MPKFRTLKRRAQRVRAAQRPLRVGCGSFNALQFAEVLKAVYLPSILEMFTKQSAMLTYLDKGPHEFAGNYYLQVPFSMRPRV